MSSRRTLSSEYSERFPGLGVLITGYVLAFADDEMATPEDAVLAFTSDYPELTASAAAGIQALLDECPDVISRGQTVTAPHSSASCGNTPARRLPLLGDRHTG